VRKDEGTSDFLWQEGLALYSHELREDVVLIPQFVTGREAFTRYKATRVIATMIACKALSGHTLARRGAWDHSFMHLQAGGLKVPGN